jgi:outer membrane protein assembly factor BamB
MPRAKRSLVYVGIKYHVVAFDRKNGLEVWRIALPAKYKSSSDFVNVVRDREGLFATCAGEIFCLDPEAGTLLWQDQLKGLGTGLVTVATDLGGTTASTVLGESAREAQAAAASGAAT